MKINNIILKPYIKGCYQVLGSLIFINNNHQIHQNILRNLLDITNPYMDSNSNEEKELSKFINNEKNWMELSRDIRLRINEFIYGNLIIS